MVHCCPAALTGAAMGLLAKFKPMLGVVLLGGMMIILTAKEDDGMSEPPPSPPHVPAAALPSPQQPRVSVAPMGCATPCQHGGVCVGKLCRCPRGYEGTSCHTRKPAPPADCAPPRRPKGDKTPPPPPRCKPSFLIIGAGKSGTSSLYYYLAAHPAVHPAVQKQLQYFDHGYPEGHPTMTELTASLETYYSRGFDHEMPNGHVTGEASPGYMVRFRI